MLLVSIEQNCVYPVLYPVPYTRHVYIDIATCCSIHEEILVEIHETVQSVFNSLVIYTGTFERLIYVLQSVFSKVHDFVHEFVGVYKLQELLSMNR